MNVVVHTDDGAVSLLVDEIGDVLEVPENAFERPPETLQGTARELIRGAYKLRGSPAPHPRHRANGEPDGRAAATDRRRIVTSHFIHLSQEATSWRP